MPPGNEGGSEAAITQAAHNVPGRIGRYVVALTHPRDELFGDEVRKRGVVDEFSISLFGRRVVNENRNRWRNQSPLYEIIVNCAGRNPIVVIPPAIKKDEQVVGSSLGRIPNRCVNPNLSFIAQDCALNMTYFDLTGGKVRPADGPWLLRSARELND